MSLKMAFDPSIEEHRKAVELFQSSLRELGITVEAEPLQFTPYVETLKTFETTRDLASIYEFSDFPDPHAVLYPHFSSDFLNGNGGYNWSQYSNPEVDALLDEAVGLPDMSARCPIYEQAQEMIASDYPVINISNGGLFAVVVVGQGVQGYEYNLAHHRTVNFYDMSISQ
jgi:peptide/nickel transport system substrate-binding protein